MCTFSATSGLNVVWVSALALESLWHTLHNTFTNTTKCNIAGGIKLIASQGQETGHTGGALCEDSQHGDSHQKCPWERLPQGLMGKQEITADPVCCLRRGTVKRSLKFILIRFEEKSRHSSEHVQTPAVLVGVFGHLGAVETSCKHKVDMYSELLWQTN